MASDGDVSASGGTCDAAVGDVDQVVDALISGADNEIVIFVSSFAGNFPKGVDGSGFAEESGQLSFGLDGFPNSRVEAIHQSAFHGLDDGANFLDVSVPLQAEGFKTSGGIASVTEPSEVVGDEVGLFVNPNADLSGLSLVVSIGGTESDHDFVDDFSGVITEDAFIGVGLSIDVFDSVNRLVVDEEFNADDVLLGVRVGSDDESERIFNVGFDDSAVSEITFTSEDSDDRFRVFNFRIAACEESNAHEANKC